MAFNRRQFLHLFSASTSTAFFSTKGLARPHPTLIARSSPISCNAYAWLTFYERQGKKWMADPDASLSEFKQAGLTAYEPSVTSVAEVTALGPLLKKYKLTMPSVYVNTTLHRTDEAQQSINSVLAIADVARTLGTTIFVTNPSPIKWGSDQDKTDSELIEQARNLDRLGDALKQRGITLAYHTHAPEHRQAAREFHHMLLATNPAHVSLCLDAHWIYRGSGNSQVALLDIIKLYGKRIVEVHIRQSHDGVWQETFGPGDIDYPRLAADLKAAGSHPLLVLEQCLEKGSPDKLNPVEAHKQDLVYAQQVFAEFLKA